MVLGFRLRGICPGVICPSIGIIHPKPPSAIHCHSWRRFNNNCDSTRVIPSRIRDGGIHCFFSRQYALSVGRKHYLAKTDEDFDDEPFWFFMLKEALGFLKSLFVFLVEQPGQLKYIEWPSFQSTLKTATLTLLLVGLLIIGLSSVDSALCYILSVLSRRRV